MTLHDTVVLVVETVMFEVLTITGLRPATATASGLYVGAPEHVAFSNIWNVTLPFKSPLPAGALIVAESFGMNDCALVSEDGTDVTMTFSLVFVQVGTPLASMLSLAPRVFGESPE